MSDKWEKNNNGCSDSVIEKMEKKKLFKVGSHEISITDRDLTNLDLSKSLHRLGYINKRQFVFDSIQNFV